MSSETEADAKGEVANGATTGEAATTAAAGPSGNGAAPATR